MPLELLALAFAGDKLQVMAYFRLNRILHLAKVLRFFHDREGALFSAIYLWRAARVATTSLLVLHVCACIFIVVGTIPDECSWTCLNGLNNVDASMLYLVSMYWTVYMVTSE